MRVEQHIQQVIRCEWYKIRPCLQALTFNTAKSSGTPHPTYIIDAYIHDSNILL